MLIALKTSMRIRQSLTAENVETQKLDYIRLNSLIMYMLLQQ